MSPEDWKEVEQSMASPYGRAVLEIDGYTVMLSTSLHKRRLSTLVYVNGVSKGIWYQTDEAGVPVHEEARRFCDLKRVALFKPSVLASLEKIYGKCSKEIARLRQTKTYCTPTWGSFIRLKRHFQRHNQNIRLVRER